MTYTQLSLLGVAVAVLLDSAVLRTTLLRRKAFWTSYAIILAFQLVTNGWLTGLGVVQYSAAAVIGGGQAQAFGDGRILFAPIEDLLFGFALVLSTLSLWVWWGRRLSRR